MGTNRYAYAGGDPVNGSDPWGNCFWDACIGEAIAAIGAAIASLFAVDAAIDISNGGEVGDSPLGNPVGQIGAHAIQGGATIVGMATGNGGDRDESSSGPGMGHNGPPEDKTTATLLVTIAGDRLMHILWGDGPTSGGHMSGVGNPGKSEFPASWGEAKIAEAIKHVGATGATTKPAHTAGSVVKEGIVDGVTIRVIINPTTGAVHTAFPLKGPGVVFNSR